MYNPPSGAILLWIAVDNATGGEAERVLTNLIG
jgi:hypothetical protein